MEGVKFVRGDSPCLKLLFQLLPCAAPFEIEMISEELKGTDDDNVVSLSIRRAEGPGLGMLQW